jgi:tetratricopeptide (TPR) repeat protein
MVLHLFSSLDFGTESNILKGDINIMKKREKLDTLFLVSITLFLFLNIFSSIAFAANNENSLVFQGNYEEAIKAFDKAIEINSQDSYAWCNKGLCLGHLGNYEEAVKAFDKAIEINSQDSNAWYNKGYSLECLGNYEEAIKAFDKAIEINSQYLNAWYNKGYSLECLGNYEEAVKVFDKAIEINSQDSDTWYNKGTCLAHLGNHNEAVEALNKAIEIDPQYDYALSLKESILLNSNKSLFSNSNIFVEEDDLLEYAQTYLKNYEDIINESNLTRDDLGLFSFYQNYPYSVNAIFSNTSGASITFIPHSIDKSKVTIVPYPICEQIPKINKEFMNSNPVRVFSVTGNSSRIQMLNNTVYTLSVNGNISGGNIWNNISYNNTTYNNGFIYINDSNNNCLYDVPDNTSIVLANGILFNGLTFIDSNKLFRVDDLIINGTLVLNDSKVIMKSNLKKDWTKENAEEDAIASINKERIDKIFDYSKLTGIGFREIDPLVTEYKEKENSGYYKTNKYEEWSDRQRIFKKADQYKIPYASVSIALENKQDEAPLERFFRYIRYVGDILTVWE